MSLSGLLLPLLLILNVQVCQSDRTDSSKDGEDRADVSPGPMDVVEAVKRKCAACKEQVSLDVAMGLEWQLFPPSIFPNPIMSFMCVPNPIGQNWDKDLDMPLCPPQAMEVNETREKCQFIRERRNESMGQYFVRKLKKIGAFHVAFVNQMLACAGCTLCEIGEMISSAFQRFGAIMKRMSHHLWRKIRGYDTLTLEEKTQSDKTIQNMIRNGLDSSLLQVGDSERLGFNSSDMEIEESITRRLQQHSSDPVEQVKHLSMMQASMDQFEASGELHQHVLDIQLNQTQSLWQQKMKQLQPALESEECMEAFSAMQDLATVDFSINVEFPDLAAALYNAVGLFPPGVVNALVPEVLLMAIPKSNKFVRRVSGRLALAHANKNKVDECLEGVGPAFREETCFDERPFLACTVRTQQKVLTQAMLGRWWPIGDKLDSEFSKTFASIKTSSRGTCLEGVEVLGDRVVDAGREKKYSSVARKPDEGYLQEKLENPDGVSERLFNARHCPVVKRLVDEVIEGEKDLPSNTSRAIWVAGILNAGESCPDFTPFVASFCADRLKCLDESKLKVARESWTVHSSASRLPDYGQPARVKFAAAVVDALRSVKHVNEQWYKVWSTLHSLQADESGNSENISWKDTANMIIHGSEKVHLSRAAEFWGAVQRYMLHRNGIRKQAENEFSRYPRTRKLFGLPISYTRLGATWKDLVKRYRGDGPSEAPICAATKGADKSRLREKADGKLPVELNFKGYCCCWEGKVCDAEQLEKLGKEGKGQVFNVVLANTSSGSDIKECCRLQKGKCGRYSRGFVRARFTKKIADKVACMNAARAEQA